MQTAIKESQYLRREDLLKKYTFISSNMLKNILYKDIAGFRRRVVRRWGRVLLFNERELLNYIEENFADKN